MLAHRTYVEHDDSRDVAADRSVPRPHRKGESPPTDDPHHDDLFLLLHVARWNCAQCHRVRNWKAHGTRYVQGTPYLTNPVHSRQYKDRLMIRVLEINH